mmetsp:Transcript_13744/g.23410  ORF Transcript_13744/g.23410 Transcript_13744/m.23410 type:complete len:239 (+) Transcript_13744:5124-5840(+)
MRVEDRGWLSRLPPGAELLPDCGLAAGISGRSAKPFHQRAQARQYSERRHVFRGSAHVGRDHQCERAARHCRCGGQVQRANCEGHRRSADRPFRCARRGFAQHLGRSERGWDGVWSCVLQGPPHGKNLRGHGSLPLWHAGLHRPWHPSGKGAVGIVDPAQGQAGCVRLPSELRRSDLQGRGHCLRRQRVSGRHWRGCRHGPQRDRAAGPSPNRGRSDGADHCHHPALSRERQISGPYL